MKRWGLVLVGLLACGTGVREVRSTGGEKIFEAKCKSTASECIADARATCSEGYELLASESHAGGAIADALPGPVTWYTMTFKCSGFGGNERPDFAFRGPTYQPASGDPPEPEAAQANESTSSSRPKRAPACSNDLSCGIGRICVKPQGSYTGTCARAVDEYGMQQFPPSRTDLGPGEGNCSYDTDCPASFKCIKGSAMRGNCMK